ncbi:hypothetical protein EXIGLDRAFT_772158 [Exidia glandulosa HHB12029]|uniref:MYND-type domain-containing protein n=1 Tax=Exidia glandulosa HHB12029 TaxID=1314781 RepID=A0A165FHM4_EXIGL|nr:hypothetical protein EXIGLDRAFT_772158 [Exidia glandulosa HHB12029]
MKAELSRAEKLVMLRKEMEALMEKAQRRQPLDPRPPKPPLHANGKEVAEELLRQARPLIEQNRRQTHNADACEDRNRRIVELMTAAIEADGTDPESIINRAISYNGLKMWKEAEDDATWAEQLVLEYPPPYSQGEASVLVDTIYHQAWSKIEQGRPEDAHADLHVAEAVIQREKLPVKDPRIDEKLALVHRQLDDYKAKYSNDPEGELLDRQTKYNGYGFTSYECALLYEAGLRPWFGAAKIALKRVNDMKLDVKVKKTREHYEMQQCHQCWKRKSEGASLLVCAKCKSALYCSKECQKAAWPGHKDHCKHVASARKELRDVDVSVNPASNVPAPDMPTNGAELLSTMQAWTTKHRPLLAESLVSALDLRHDPTSHTKKTMVVLVEWRSGDLPTAKRFRMITAALQDMTAVGSQGSDIAATRARLDAEHRRQGGFGVAMMTIVCVTANPSMLNVAPVYLDKGIHLSFKRNEKWLNTLSASLG